MTNILEGEDVSLWVGTTDRTSYPQLSVDNLKTDILVVGGGITGVITAYYLQKAGLKTVLIDKSRIVEWTTGSTTAKLSSQHYLAYNFLINKHGREAAQAFANANEQGINDIEALSSQLSIDSEFERRQAYVYTQKQNRLDEMKTETEASRSLGLPAHFETDIDLPFDITGAVVFDNQAQFHPRKFLLGVAREFEKLGGVIYENTKAQSIEPGDINTITTNHGVIEAKYVVQASGEPFWKNEIFDGFMWLKMSYALGVTLKNEEDYPHNMYITPDDPMRTIRTAYQRDGKKIMIFGGESHEYDDDTFDADKHYKALIDDVKEKFEVDEVKFRWLAGDYMPYDRMPYIGAMPGSDSVFVVTGYRAWGLAWAMSAAKIITGDITGEPLEWAKHFRLDRLSTPIPGVDKVHGV